MGWPNGWPVVQKALGKKYSLPGNEGVSSAAGLIPSSGQHIKMGLLLPGQKNES